MPRQSFPETPRGGWLIGLLAVAGLALAAEPEGTPPPAATAQLPQVGQPLTVGELLAQADAAAAEKRWPAAIAGWQAVLAREPARHELRQRLAEALLNAGRSAEARSEYERLQRERPSADNHFRLCGLLRDSGAMRAALRLAEQGQAAYPADPRFPTLRADLLLRLGDPAGAAQLASVLPASADGQLVAGRLAEAGEQWAAACQAYRRALAAGAGQPAEAGRQRCLRQSVKVGGWQVFAAPGWQPLAGRAAFQQQAGALEVEVGAAPAGAPEAALRAALTARVPRELLTPAAPPEYLAAFAAASQDHEAGKGQHTDASEAEHQSVLEALQAPVAIVVDPASAGQPRCARAAPRASPAPAGLPAPWAACLSPDGKLVYLLAGKIDAESARRLLGAALAGGREEE